MPKARGYEVVFEPMAGTSDIKRYGEHLYSFTVCARNKDQARRMANRLRSKERSGGAKILSVSERYPDCRFLNDPRHR